MKSIAIFKLALLASILFASSTYAVIIEGSFRGTVTTFYNGSEDPALTGYWDNVSVGSEASGSFWYDTEKAPHTAESENSLWYNSFTDEWIGSSFFIDGKTYITSDAPRIYNTDASREWISVQYADPLVDGSSREFFQLVDSAGTALDALNPGDLPSDYSLRGFNVQLLSEEAPMLNGASIIQQFDWYKTSDTKSRGLADLYIESVANGLGTGSFAELDISEFHIGVKNSASVPEPSPIILLCLGIFVLVLRFRRLQVK